MSRIDEIDILGPVKNPTVFERCRALLDQWSSVIPFSPVSRLGSDCEFVAAFAHPTFHITASSLVETRQFTEQEQPYKGAVLPQKAVPKNQINIESFTFPPPLQFATHHLSHALPETRRAYACNTCEASGKVTCGSCDGSRLEDCAYCDGFGSIECSACEGAAHIAKTRTHKQQAECHSCGGTGQFNERLSCSRCHGRGTIFEDVEEEYYVPCTRCGATGKLTCKECRGRGRVTCSTCEGKGIVTCHRCDGERRLLSEIHIEVNYEARITERQYISPRIPEFTNKASPRSNLQGEIVLAQEEAGPITQLQIQDPAVASLLLQEINFCRELHQGKIVRQGIEVSVCVIIEYQYRWSGKICTAFINVDHGLVSDIDGPVQSYFAGMRSAGRTALDQNEPEKAFRLALRSLCVDEPTPAAKHLRNEALGALRTEYQWVGLGCWGVAAGLWVGLRSWLFSSLPEWSLLLGLVPLEMGQTLFADDLALFLDGRTERRTAITLFALICFLGGAATGGGNVFTDWIGWLGLMTLLTGTLLYRDRWRSFHRNLERRTQSDDPKLIQKRILALDPVPRRGILLRRVLSFAAVVFAIQPCLRLLSSLDQSVHIAGTVRLVGEERRSPVPVTVAINSSVGRSLDVTPGSEEAFDVSPRHIGAAALSFSAPGFETVRIKCSSLYGLKSLGRIDLVRQTGTLDIACGIGQATIRIFRDGESVSRYDRQGSPIQLPTGRYTIVASYAMAEESREVGIETNQSTKVDFNLPRGDLSLRSYPEETDFVLSRQSDGRTVQMGKTPAKLTGVGAGEYLVTFKSNDVSVSRQVVVKAAENSDLSVTLPLGDVLIESSGSAGDTRYELVRSGAVIKSGSLPALLTRQHVGLVDVVASDQLSTQRKKLRVTAAETAHVNFVFSYGTIAASTHPDGASIVIESDAGVSLQGIAPLTTGKIPAGIYRLRASYKGEEVAQTVQVEANLQRSVTFDFPGGMVTVQRRGDNVNYVLTSTSTRVRLQLQGNTAEYIPRGKYILETYSRGMIVATTPVAVDSGSTITLNPQAQLGSLTIATNCTDVIAELISYDQTPVFSGALPQELHDLAPGRYWLRCTKSGKIFRRDIEIRAGAQRAFVAYPRNIAEYFAGEPNIRRFPRFARRISSDYKAVWQAVLEVAAKQGHISRMDRAMGTVEVWNGPRGGFRPLAGLPFVGEPPKKFYYILVSDFDGETEIQIVASLYDTRLEVDTSNGQYNPKHLDSDNIPGASRLAEDFLNDVEKRVRNSRT